jgi:hypothetical protein
MRNPDVGDQPWLDPPALPLDPTTTLGSTMTHQLPASPITQLSPLRPITGEHCEPTASSSASSVRMGMRELRTCESAGP